MGSSEKNSPFFSPDYQQQREPHPTFLLNLAAVFRWRECPWGSYFQIHVNMTVLPINFLNPLFFLCPDLTAQVMGLVDLMGH